MSETVVGILGFLCIVAIVIALFRSKMLPCVAFIIFPIILAVILVIGGYYDFDNIAELIKAGFQSTGPTAALFVFSVLYFGIMTDAGMFDVIIRRLMKIAGGSVVGVAAMTCVIALIGHLDGGGASTFCILIPAMLPVYKKMHMRSTSLLRIAVLAMGILNLMPWAGPTMRAASVLDMDAGKLWGILIPIQIFGIVLAFANAVIVGLSEKKRGAGLDGRLAQADTENIVNEKMNDDVNDLARPNMFVFNVILTVSVIALLIWDIFPSYVPFMLGMGLAIIVNYLGAGLQKKVVYSHAGPALMMCSTLMGAAVLMGILVKGVTVNDIAVPSVVTCMANLIRMILPDILGRHLPLVIGILSVPLALAFDTDSYFYGMLPVMLGIGKSFGIPAIPIAVAMVVCRNCATFVSPMVPATLLGVGLADVDIKDHIRSSFFWTWGFSILCMIFAIIIGLIPL